MEYELTNLTKEKVNLQLLDKVICKVSELLNVNNSFVSVVLTDNKHIHEINKTYRNIDRETDVISFAFMDNDENIKSDITDLGEIYISLEKAHSQAEDYNHSFEREICFLLVHGLLHLLGYDHMNEKDEKEMFGLQDEILSSLGVER